MANKNRVRKTNIFIAREGDREEIFLNYLQELFDSEQKLTLKFSLEKGGNSNAILDRALKNNFYPKVYAWFDEDDSLDKEHKEILERLWDVKFPNDILDRELQSYNKKMRNPIVLVSNPLSVEGILIRLFNHNIPKLIDPITSEKDFEKNKNRMKSSVKGFMGNLSDMEYYKKNLTVEQIITKTQEIEELKLLLKIFNIEV